MASGIALAFQKSVVGFAAQMLSQGTFSLSTAPCNPDDYSIHDLQTLFARLNTDQKNCAYLLRWEMAKMEDTRVSGEGWGQEHFWDDSRKVALVLQRMGILGTGGTAEIAYNLRLFGGMERAQSFYYSLSEKLGCEAPGGRISYVNGMGTAPDRAGSDVARISTHLADGNNLYCVYLPTRQDAPMGDLGGFLLDAIRYLAVEGGSYTRTSCLIAQQWIHYLVQEPDKCFLQTCHSEGAAHVHAALRILRENRPDLISRLRLITFCGASIIEPLPGERLQVINFFKLEDHIPTDIAGGRSLTRQPFLHVRVVPHTTGNPHDHLSQDFVDAAKPHFDLFMRSGSLFP
ncbi:MAG: hypothetical protein V4492_03890 [Chlamydiota bacterium]